MSDDFPSAGFPVMTGLRQLFPRPVQPDIRREIEQGLRSQILPNLVKSGARIALGVGSRGIANLPRIVGAVVDVLKAAGASPFIIPAMGSHGGATPEGQQGILEEYGVEERALGAPIRPSLEVECIGRTDEGFEVYCSVEALRADGILLINRVKPHTDFQGTLGSGILKMSVIGLGKRHGAAACHRTAPRLGYEKALRSMAAVVLRTAPILGGVAIIENQHHDTARIEVLGRDQIEEREKALLDEARRLMARLPLDDLDLLIVDRIGKNISGAGMDPNVTGRWVHGYSTSLADDNPSSPRIRRIFVRDLTPETLGNAIGIGFADFTTTRLARAMDNRATYLNALTSLTPNGAKIPIHFETDRECIAQALASLALNDPSQARVLRIRDTLSLTRLEASESCIAALSNPGSVEILTDSAALQFDASGNLADLPEA